MSAQRRSQEQSRQHLLTTSIAARDPLPSSAACRWDPVVRWDAHIRRKCVLGDTLPNVPIRFAKTSRDRRWKNNSGCPSGKFRGRYVGGVGRNNSQFIATPSLEATA